MCGFLFNLDGAREALYTKRMFSQAIRVTVRVPACKQIFQDWNFGY